MDDVSSEPGRSNGRPAWARWTDIALRTVHIGASGVFVGGHVLGTAPERLGVWLGLTVATGLGLIGTEVHHSRNWPHQGRGLMVLAKLLLLGVLAAWQIWRVPIMAAAVVIGSVGSHMPKRYRHWSARYRRVVD